MSVLDELLQHKHVVGRKPVPERFFAERVFLLLDDEHRRRERQALGISVGLAAGLLGRVEGIDQRSEEHTSELPSLAYLVCRLLPEKKHATASTVLASYPDYAETMTLTHDPRT